MRVMDSTEKPQSHSKAPHWIAGIEAENRAVCFLEQQGIQILKRNFRVRGGEIDIVAQEGQTLIFVEVRCRQKNAYGGAIGSLNSKKIKRIQLAAALYLQQYGTGQACRLDLLCQVGSHDSKWEWVRGLL